MLGAGARGLGFGAGGRGADVAAGFGGAAATTGLGATVAAAGGVLTGAAVARGVAIVASPFLARRPCLAARCPAACRLGLDFGLRVGVGVAVPVAATGSAPPGAGARLVPRYPGFLNAPAPSTTRRMSAPTSINGARPSAVRLTP